MLTVVPVEGHSGVQPPDKKMKFAREPIAFDDDDLERTIQPHDDALVVMAWISGFLVKRVMVDQGSEADVMYSDLFRGLEQRKENRVKHTSSLVRFNGKVVIPKEQISLPVIMEGKEVVVTFTIVTSFSRIRRFGKTVDPFNGGCPVDHTCKDQVSNRVGCHRDKGRPASGQTVSYCRN